MGTFQSGFQSPCAIAKPSEERIGKMATTSRCTFPSSIIDFLKGSLEIGPTPKFEFAHELPPCFGHSPLSRDTRSNRGPNTILRCHRRYHANGATIIVSGVG